MNKNIFGSTPGSVVPRADTTNEAGGRAYKRTAKEALAQFAVTGCFNDTFYVDAETQLKDVLALAAECDPEFVAKVAIYARVNGKMKDMPAALLATLASTKGLARNLALLKRAFPQVVNNGKMLRNFVQFIRSGAIGRKSFAGRGPLRKLVQRWFDERTDEQLFNASIGTSPSLADIIRLAHIRPPAERDPIAAAELFNHRARLKARATAAPGTVREPMPFVRRNETARSHMLAYLVGRPYDLAKLPKTVQDFEAFRAGILDGVPNVNFQLVADLPLTPEQWKQLCRNASWQTLRMNLNTFARHGCFDDRELLRLSIERLVSPTEIEKSGVMPYQLMAAYLHVDSGMQPGLKMALGQAMEVACRNVPRIAGQLAIGVDVSGSMSSAVTGHRKGATTAMRCVDVAALVACALLRANPTAFVLPFDTNLHIVGQSPGASFGAASIVDAAQVLSRFGGGGTACELPLRWLVHTRQKVDLVVMVSDNESWFDRARGRGTASMEAWRHLKALNPTCKLVCIDLTPNKSTQVQTEPDVANVGGFSDDVFDFLKTFAEGGGQWAERIEAAVTI